jgi:hypothetical protein
MAVDTRPFPTAACLSFSSLFFSKRERKRRKEKPRTKPGLVGKPKTAPRAQTASRACEPNVGHDRSWIARIAPALFVNHVTHL